MRAETRRRLTRTLTFRVTEYLGAAGVKVGLMLSSTHLHQNGAHTKSRQEARCVGGVKRPCEANMTREDNLNAAGMACFFHWSLNPIAQEQARA